MPVLTSLIFIFTLAVLSACASSPRYLIEDSITSGSMGSSASRIDNFAHHLDHPGREAAAKTVVTQLLDRFSHSLMP